VTSAHGTAKATIESVNSRLAAVKLTLWCRRKTAALDPNPTIKVRGPTGCGGRWEAAVDFLTSAASCGSTQVGKDIRSTLRRVVVEAIGF